MNTNMITQINPADNLKKLNDLLSVLGQSVRDGIAPTEEIETCLGIAWDLGNCAYNILTKSSTIQLPYTLPSESEVNSTTTQQATAVGTTNQRFAIGTRIRELRKERMLTQAELAKSVDVQPNLVTMWESNTTEPRAKHIMPLANALKCDPIWLLTGNPVDVKPAPPAPVNVMKGADLANIGVRIESRRDKMGMSPLKLAEEIDTSGAMIREWETGKAIPHSDYIDKLAKALNTTVTWLMTGKDITA